jgi:hypothetical protein
MSRMRIRLVVSSMVPVLALAAGSAAAQIPLAPRALGMGGAYIASARGFESVLFNPANLALPDGPAWSVSFPQITIGSSVLGAEVSDLPDFVNYDELTPERRDELLAKIPETGTSVDLVVRAPVASVQVGRIGVAVSYAWTGEHTIGKDLVELFLEGYDQNRTDYRIGNTVGTRASFWDLAAGYAERVGPVTLGVTGHYYRGGTLVRTMAFEPRYSFIAPFVQVDYAGVYSRDGRGYGLDVGAAIQPMPGLTLSGALANVVSSFDWSEELTGRSITLTEDDFQNGDFMTIEERWDASEEDLGTTPTGRFATVAAGLNREAWTVPTTLKLGAAYRPIPGTEVGAAYHASQADEGEGLLGGRWDGLLGAGVQQRLPYVTVRLGASSDLEDGGMFSAGLKLGVLDLAIAKFTTGSTLDDSNRDGWAGSMSVNVRTQATLR